jgi:hypothetical protein
MNAIPATAGAVNSTYLASGLTLATPTLTSPTMSGAVVSAMASSVITSGTAVASTSGTSIDFTGIPSWVKRITVMFNGVSLSGTADLMIQLGSGSITTTGYVTTWGFIYTASSVGVNSATTAILRAASINSSTTWTGIATVNLIANNTWCGSSTLGSNTDKIISYSSGSIALGGILDRVRITTNNGTDTFDAGSINILYE